VGAKRIANLSGPIADFRILLRYYGLIPLTRYWLYLQADKAPRDPLAHKIEKIQCLCNFIYYPLEHTYWLMMHEVIPSSTNTMNQIGYWSCRFWAAYVVLEFVRLWLQHRQLTKKAQLAKQVDAAQASEIRREVALERKQIRLGTIINTAYLPLTVHWSLENSSFPDVGVGIFGTIAALAQFYVAWQATAV
jgi:hypothetical protein